jgi:FAD:protein FMN transferase
MALPLMNRRSFLQTLSILTAGWTVKGWAAPLSINRFSSFLVQVSETRNLMGTFVTITLFHASSQKGQAILGAAFKRMEALISLFNRHQNDSPVGYLNERGFLIDPPGELFQVIRSSVVTHSRTGGAFDITVKPLLDLYEAEKDFNRLPSVESIRDALNRLGIADMEIGPRKIAFRKEGMGITLDGIAKGSIVDRIIYFLQEKGILHALVDAGGDLRVIGGRSSGLPWRIAVYDPTQGIKSSEMISLHDGAVATSGNYMVFYDQEKIHHHILSPKSGRSSPWEASSTVLAPLAEEADALATSLMVLSPEEGMDLINRDHRLAAMLINKKGQRTHSLRWPNTSKIIPGSGHHA